ncbi:nucleotide sugar dehydrogenase [Vibrio breoganii]|uniref:nucleotide sugar dehydrogenase n=3 Tax=Vibrio breoganii TaxID=553239 RepID=UPI000CC69F53|nr:nucleotide sugar dehydrogenase [Vibrio breoganii]PML57098.1 Vi polysaccharide biosynthesis protein VipA/TviB [Vibrio breoganii]PMO80941.1 Vi polysaccharide biosynthesis protein VipA/TviB [Vibrio breoganii]PMP05083.1 Vi polysaccharide biosynthesis protein VipA/TviB [Vibrio breoganii]
MNIDELKIAIIGLGYVGLPLSIELSKKNETIGFDIDSKRVNDLIKGVDYTNECSVDELQSAGRLRFSSDFSEVASCDVYIVTVPTPIDEFNVPDLTPLKKASEMIGSVLNENNFVIYESTVYPGATEEICKPILEQVSNLKMNENFYLGYSPERINPGDKDRRVSNIKKVTSGSNIYSSEIIDQIYSRIITVGTHKASSIKVAEASKIIENTQRDVNIALMNEFKMIFDKLEIDTKEVIEAAATKWNFIKLVPGLVGGHCISVDPYYLVHKAQEVGFIPDIMKSSREINNNMAGYIANEFVKRLLRSGHFDLNKKILILGFSFKANCPDIRNTKVNDVIKELNNYGLNIDVYDPVIDTEEVKNVYSINIYKDLKELDSKEYTAVLQLVNHVEFEYEDFRRFISTVPFFYTI